MSESRPDADPAQQDQRYVRAAAPVPHVGTGTGEGPAAETPGGAPEAAPRETAGEALSGDGAGYGDGAGAGDEARQEPEDGLPGDAPESQGPRPLGLGVTPTGHDPVDSRLRRLQDADHLAVSGHREVYEDVHRGLRDTLTALDRPAPAPAPVPGPQYPRS
jgi:hypothetical protein